MKLKKHLEDCYKKFDVSKNEKTFENDKKEAEYNYNMSILRLPNGFKRDYAVGISSNPHIFYI